MKNKKNLSSQAYDKFKELLFEKVWKPGDFISQPELISKTGFSLSPMRDALHKLSAEGLVLITPRKGIQITPSSIKIIREVFHLRKILEKEAVIFFINNAHEEVINKLIIHHDSLVHDTRCESLPTKMRDIIIYGENIIYAEIINFMGNELLSRIYSLNTDRIRLFRTDYEFTYSKKHVLDIINEHAKIIEAISKKDVKLATRKLDQHINMSLKRALGPPYF